MDALATRGHIILDDAQVRLRTGGAAQRFTDLFKLKADSFHARPLRETNLRPRQGARRRLEPGYVPCQLPNHRSDEVHDAPVRNGQNLTQTAEDGWFWQVKKRFIKKIKKNNFKFPSCYATPP